MGNRILLEYIWLDGYKTPNLRSKIKTMDWNTSTYVAVDKLPLWNFDGSSTNQAPGNSSECLLQPVRLYEWAKDHYFVLCEVLNPDGSPHKTNSRNTAKLLNKISEEGKYWWGFEQEFFMTKNYKPAGFPTTGYPPPQGMYYCGVGEGQVVGRKLSEVHLKKCLSMGIEITGTNAEVAIGQWEYQCFSDNTLKACDDLWMSRYVLYRLGEEYGFGIDFNPKPIQGDWNGSGCHTNFSTEWMRNGTRGKNGIINLMELMKKHHHDHIKDYGENNAQRLTGLHETQHINSFSYGVGDRGASIRIPTDMKNNGWKGYLEDRRPASNCDPYLVVKNIMQTTRES